jgi:hypothetical protein
MKLKQKLKRLIKIIIHKILIVLGVRKYIQSRNKYKIYKSNKKHTFFGYYDKTPFTSDGKKLLAMTADVISKPLKSPSISQVGYFNIDDPTTFNLVGETSTWCWQLGSRFMWYGADNQTVIYNREIKDHYGSVIQNINNKEIIKEFHFPVYDITGTGDYGLSVNFSRLGRLRPGYGYINFPDNTNGIKYPSNDGVWLCDLKSNTKKLIIDLERIVNFKFDDKNLETEHYINHLSFNPSGSRFLFFHVWNNKGKRYTRAITSDLQGQNLYLLNEGRSVSHYAWRNDEELIMTAVGKHHFGYFLFRDLSECITPISPQSLTIDGHPGFINDEKIITDTYPQGFFNEQQLLLVDFNGILKNIAKIHSSYFNVGESKCDLHPRLDFKRENVAVDFSSKNRRMISVFQVTH